MFHLSTNGALATLVTFNGANGATPFGTLVETGMIAPGTELTDSKRRWSARVCADGSIEQGGIQGSIHQIGAAVQNAPACNGWIFWHFERDGRLVPLDVLRSAEPATDA